MTLVKDILRIEEERALRRGEEEVVVERLRSRVQVAALVHENLPEIEEEEEEEEKNGKKDTLKTLRFFTKSELSTATRIEISSSSSLLPYVSLGGRYFLLKTFSEKKKGKRTEEEKGSALDLVNLLALTAELSGIGGLLLPSGVCFEKPFTLLLELPPDRFIPLKSLLSISSCSSCAPLASVLSSWLHRIQVARGIAFVLRRLHSLDSPIAHGDLSSLVVFVDLLRIGAVIHYVPLPTTRCVLISNLNFKWKQGREATSSPSSSPASPSGIEEDIIALGDILLELLETTTGGGGTKELGGVKEEEKMEELTLEVVNQWRNLVTVCVHTPSAITAEDIQKELEDIYVSINK
jgi:hypothetical protein